ncbi:MAG TPA: GMC family oxidoreductase [Campylobacterales bacterium]|nr:GMC family oxidoreductase [Campylobacterales bacterium]
MVDICIIGSGAGAGPIAYELSLAGAKVLILEKGDFYREEDFSKDEIAFSRRSIISSKLKEEFHLIEDKEDGEWVATPTYASGWDFWNGNLVGGSSNLMSGFFHRLHPKDFRLKSEFGEIKGANIVDWPISYEEMEPFYEKTERVVGISGEVTPFKYLEPRSTKDFPYPPTQEHPISKYIDKAAKQEGVVATKTPRAIMSVAKGKRNPCYYSNYCGSYGCSSGAKSSARAALLEPALQSGNLEIKTKCFVKKLHTDENNKIKEVEYIDENGKSQRIKAKTFVLAAQAVESSRLLLNSKSKAFPNGLSNNSGQVGKNLLFSGGGVVSGHFDESVIPLDELMSEGLFVNRTIKDWYFLEGQKGGISEALFEHANPIVKSNKQKWQDEGLIWGEKLYDKIYEKLNKNKMLTFEIFNDWLPNDDCFVSVDDGYHDKFDTPVAKIRIGAHPQNVKIGEKIAKKTVKVLQAMGAKYITEGISPYPPQNLQAGGCRFGDDPKTSVLDKECRAHEVKNLFVTDGSFMPTGGSVPFTWTIYANSFRVAEVIKKEFNLAKKS